MKKGNKFIGRIFLGGLILALLFVPLDSLTAMGQVLGEQSQVKEEVYGILNADGKGEETYLITRMQVEKDGEFSYYGNYSSVENISSEEEITLDGEKATFFAKKGDSSFKGELKENQLPWMISIKYFLDGKEVEGNSLAGVNGNLEIIIDTKKNGKITKGYFENYMLQGSVTTRREVCPQIETNGNIVSSGETQVVNFVVLPEKEGHFTWKGQVNNFAMEGIRIAGVPFSMPLETPDTSQLTAGLTRLAQGIDQLSQGASSLESGALEMKTGINAYAEGISDFSTGISTLAGNSDSLVAGSMEIKNGLSQITVGMENAGDMGQLIDGLNQLSVSLEELESGLTTLRDGYEPAYTALATSINGIPSPISQADIQALVIANPGDPTLTALMAQYEAAQNVRGTYGATQPAFDGVLPALDGTISGISQVKANLDTITASLGTMDFNQLKSALEQLNSSYETFHSGLVTFSGGVKTSSEGAENLDTGASDLAFGSNELYAGAVSLASGSRELATQCATLPTTISGEIEKQMSAYDKSDFVPISFASGSNGKVNSIQFVMSTEAISEEATPIEKKTEKKETFLERLKKLFS